MNKKTVVSVIIVFVVLCLLVACLGWLFYKLAGGAKSIFENINEASQVGENLGTQPPEAANALDALPSKVGSYTLDKESIQSIEIFYEFHVDDDAYTGSYEGPDGKVELTIIQARSPGGAENYMKAMMDWTDENMPDAYLTTLNMPGKKLILYSSPDLHGHAWSSQEWVISIEANTLEARDAFYESLPYR